MNPFQKYCLDRIDQCPRFREAREFFGSEFKWAAARGLHGSSVSCLAAALTRERTAPWIIITAESERAEEIFDNLQYFGVGEVYHYPKWDILPYEEEEPVVEIRAKHAETRDALLAWRSGEALGRPAPVVVAPVDALLQKVAPPELFAARTLRFEWGEQIDTRNLAERLAESGYERTALVESRGEFSIRGGIIDIFPIDAEQPVRIDLFGDEIESVRLFDVYTQRSERDIDMEHPMRVLPAKLHDMLRARLAVGELAAFADYTTPSARLILEGAENYETVAARYQEIVNREAEAALKERAAGQRSADPEPPERLYLGFSDLQRRLIEFQRLSIYTILPLEAENASRVIEFETASFDNVAPDLDHYLTVVHERQVQDYLVNIVCDNDGQAMRLKEMLDERGIGSQIIRESDTLAAAFKPRAAIEGYQDVVLSVGLLSNGFEWPAARVVCVTDREIFGRYKRRHVYRKLYKGRPIASAADIQRGDLVIHVEHGLGRSVGLRAQEIDGKLTEFIEIEYEDDGRLLVPIEKVKYVQKFMRPSAPSRAEGGGGESEPKLDSLGGKRWERRKRKSQEAIEEMAGELLELYARRAVSKAHQFGEDTVWQAEFEASFIYQETPDQLRAIGEVKTDMKSDKPMDRLICGDVAFGKTEVAIRAAFKAVQEGKQVALLAPTTILAQQHYNTLRERFADYPIRVAMLSRFRTAAEQRKEIADLRLGLIQVVVGTHRLLSKDVGFADLGLVIVDEEQRFGVKQKERLKEMRASVDILTLSATPIPRTLHMALSGIRDLSLIATPPADRLPIKTRVIQFDRDQIAEAILRELNRGGQVYFVHNRVHNIEAVAQQIQEIAPRARIAIAHGQMNEHNLERVMAEFIDGQHDILLATTIIENGLDIPNVNTIVINRADAFGLAQLYQLRGRVGRDVKRAYAYLIVPAGQPITDLAVKRLQAIEEFTELGVGFNVAMRDMEIRGVGNILGAKQHGVMEEIGFELYCQMLEEAVKKLRGESVTATPAAEVKWSVSCALPRGYVPIESQRIAIYKRLANAREIGEIDELRDELRDRYGQLPAPAANLIDIARLRVLAGAAGLARIAATDFGFRLVPAKADGPAQSKAEGSALFAFIARIRDTAGVPPEIRDVRATGAGEINITLDSEARRSSLPHAIALCGALSADR